MKRRPKIGDAKQLCQETGARAVIVIALEGNEFVGASYGETKSECKDAGMLLDYIYHYITRGGWIWSAESQRKQAAAEKGNNWDE